MKHCYSGQFFSVFGDSISTLGNYTEPSDLAFYEGIRKFEADVFLPEDTWWGKVIETLGGFILVNHSVAGGTVSKRPDHMIPTYGCSAERTRSLDRDGVNPDVIMIFMGINDWACGARLMPADETEENDISIFSVAYRKMIENLRKHYPKAELWCFTLPLSTCKKKENFVFPHHRGKFPLAQYCDVIRDCAAAQGCRVIDLHRYAEPYDTIDDFHPNAEGMKTLADAVLGQL